MSLIILFSVITILLACFALVATFASWRWSPAIAWCAMIPLVGLAEWQFLLYWGLTALIALGINYMLPADIAKSRVGVSYIAGGALTAAVVDVLLIHSNWGIVVGAAVGAMLGALVHGRTSKGKLLVFPSKQFFNYLCVKGLPITVNISLIVIAFTLIISYFTNPAA